MTSPRSLTKSFFLAFLLLTGCQSPPDGALTKEVSEATLAFKSLSEVQVKNTEEIKTVFKESIKSAADDLRNLNVGGEPKFKIFFSPLVRADTFLLDTQSGSVYQMYGTGNRVDGFSPIEVEPKPTEGSTGQFMINFSPLVRADTFLIDTDSGKTWILTDNKGNSKFVGLDVTVEN